MMMWIIHTSRAACAALLLAMASEALAQDPVNTAFTYQGRLEDGGTIADGPYDLQFRLFDDTDAGTQVGETVTLGDVAVSEGLFTVKLDFGDVFDGTALFLDVRVRAGNSTGAFTVLAPRQALTAAPFALYALKSLAGYENVLVVAKSGGDFTSIEAALAATATASATNRYLVWVAPGVYDETGLLHVRAFVHLQGAGQNATVIRSSRSGNTQSPEAATIQLDDNGRVSEANVVNAGTGIFSIAIHTAGATRAAVVENVTAEATGTGGTAHFAIYLNDSEPTVDHSVLRASGATTANGALAAVNVAAGFPQPLITKSRLEGIGPGSGFGVQLSSAAPDVRHSVIYGDHRAISGAVAGITEVQNSQLQVSGTAGAFLVETSGSANVLVAASQLLYAGNKLAPISAPGSLTCVVSYKGNYTAANGSCD